jgi:hypothetical protein
MKLSASTIQVLKNFSLINQSILFRKGSVISTISPNKEILAKASVQESFETQFAIYDLVRLLGVLSLFEEPEIEFESNCLLITKNKETVSFFYADPLNIVVPPERDIVLKEPEIGFEMTNQIYSSIMKALHVLQLPSVAVVGDRETIKLVAMDAEKKTNNNKYEIEVGSTQHEFRMVFKGEHMKLLPGNYKVDISSAGISYFKGDVANYWIAFNSKQSSFTK